MGDFLVSANRLLEEDVHKNSVEHGFCHFIAPFYAVHYMNYICLEKSVGGGLWATNVKNYMELYQIHSPRAPYDFLSHCV